MIWLDWIWLDLIWLVYCFGGNHHYYYYHQDDYVFLSDYFIYSLPLYSTMRTFNVLRRISVHCDLFRVCSCFLLFLHLLYLMILTNFYFTMNLFVCIVSVNALILYIIIAVLLNLVTSLWLSFLLLSLFLFL